ncbi:ATP-dependent nuclease [Demequina capsici]|uniref:AAA family ATPase n=1 Tax=Demequina capsici TaxID=3075620 RepID=A0AA96F3M6_9MICO|nr:AAA family ATPase [Demequina sp. OYTSA14]WNM23302.1 AAA family ATPase [Demequina sp. OYTSA14]
MKSAPCVPTTPWRQVWFGERSTDNVNDVQPPTNESAARVPERATARVAHLTFNDGTPLSIPPDAIVVFIGANNSGKSQALKDMCYEALGIGSGNQRVVVTSVRWQTSGSAEALKQYLEDSGRVSSRSGDHVLVSRRMGSDLSSFLQQWGQDQDPHRVAPFVMYADTEQRLRGSHPVAAAPGYDGPRSEPLQRLSRSKHAQDELASASVRAFARPVFLDRWTGDGQWSLKAGEKPEYVEGQPPDHELRRIESLPLLKDEGDGVKSFVGILLEWQASNHQVAFIDEPEAFLHPPQATMLGQELSRLTSVGERQLFVSTHSRDMLLALLSGTQPVLVVRLHRDGDSTRVSRLSREQVETLWADALLRQSNIFDGLFSQEVILCEGDTDCAFYGEVLARAQTVRDGETLPASGPAFRHTNGKDRIAVAANALRAAGVPLSAIVDIDVFGETKSFNRLVESMGGEPHKFAADLETVQRALDGQAPDTTVDAVREKVLPLLARPGRTPITDADREQLREAFKSQSALKRFGKAGLRYFESEEPNADALESCRSLIRDCHAIGIHVVPNGALESWAPELRTTKGRWLVEALERGIDRLSRFGEAVAFVTAATEAQAPPAGTSPLQTVPVRNESPRLL